MVVPKLLTGNTWDCWSLQVCIVSVHGLVMNSGNLRLIAENVCLFSDLLPCVNTATSVIELS